MNIIEQCARCCREQFGHRPVPDWWDQMHQGAREHWIAGTNAVLAEFARLAQSEEMVEKIAKALYDDWRDEIDPPADEPWEEAEGFQALWKQRARHVLAALFRETEVTP
jgi:hypothetical protein